MNLVVLVDKNWAIGKDGNQLVYIKQDLARFRELTSDNIIVYGRKTLETFPGAKVLPGRENWVLTRNVDLEVPNARMFNDIEELKLAILEAEGSGKTVTCIGGGTVYEQLLPLVDTAYVTKMYRAWEGADVFFPNLDESSEWYVADTSEAFTAGKKQPFEFKFIDYKRV